jgi:hypothetical protein
MVLAYLESSNVTGLEVLKYLVSEPHLIHLSILYIKAEFGLGVGVSF